MPFVVFRSPKKEGSRAPTGAGAERRTRGPPRGRAHLRERPEMTAGYADRCASRRPAAAFFLTASGRAFRDWWAPLGPRPSCLSGQDVRATFKKADQLRQPAPGRGISPPGGAPTPPVCRLRAEHPGAARSKARISPGAQPPDSRTCSPIPPPACSATKTPHDDAPQVSKVDGI
jgi:hypothetical protein